MNRGVLIALALGVAFVMAGGSSCGSNATSSGAGGQGGTSPSGGTSGGAGGADSGASTCGAGGAAPPTSGCGTPGPVDAASTYTNPGVCGDRGQATADAASFDGYEERFIIGEAGLGSDVCAVRFDLKRVGDGPCGCSFCSWTHLLEYSNPRVMTDTDGVCANSDLALSSDAIAKLVGTRTAIGFAKQYQGSHGSVRMKYDECSGTWEVDGNATWNESSKTFSYIFRNGTCNFGP